MPDSSELVDCRSTPRRPLTDPDLTHDWTPQHDAATGLIASYYCPDCLIAGAPTSTLCPDRVAHAVATARIDGARAMLDKVRERTVALRVTIGAVAESDTCPDVDMEDEIHDLWLTVDLIDSLDPAAVVRIAPIPSPALGCAACPNFVADGGNAGGWWCRAVDDSIGVGLWINAATGATNGYMPDGSAGEVPSDARTCPAFGRPAVVVGSGS